MDRALTNSSEVEYRTYVNEVIGTSTIIFRDMKDADVDYLVPYWRDRPDDKLEILGVPRAVLGSEYDIRERLMHLVDHGDPDHRRFGYIFELDGKPIGYVNIHYLGDGRAFPHIHFISDNVRGKGLGSLILYRVAKAIMHEKAIDTLLLQSRPGNPAINKLLQHVFRLKPELRFIEKPDGGLALPGDFNCYDLNRSHLDAIEDPLDLFRARGKA